jgi:hypothetical protein
MPKTDKYQNMDCDFSLERGKGIREESIRIYNIICHIFISLKM